IVGGRPSEEGRSMAGGQPVSVTEGLRTLWAAGALGAAEDAALRGSASGGVRGGRRRSGGWWGGTGRWGGGGGGRGAGEAAWGVRLGAAGEGGRIRVGTTVAPWLYGVARRVAARARARAAARCARGEQTARVVAAGRTGSGPARGPREEDWEAVHEEVD